MAYLDTPINANDLPDDTGGDYTPLPEGEYQVVIKNAAVLPTKSDPNGQVINLRLDVQGPTHVGRVVFSNINIRNKSEQAEQIGRGQLKAVMSALGIATLTDTDQLIGGQLIVKLSVRAARTDEKTGKTYEASNDVKAYKPAGGAPMAAPGAMPKPAAAAPAKSAPPWATKRQ